MGGVMIDTGNLRYLRQSGYARGHAATHDATSNCTRIAAQCNAHLFSLLRC